MMNYRFFFYHLLKTYCRTVELLILYDVFDFETKQKLIERKITRIIMKDQKHKMILIPFAATCFHRTFLHFCAVALGPNK